VAYDLGSADAAARTPSRVRLRGRSVSRRPRSRDAEAAATATTRRCLPALSCRANPALGHELLPRQGCHSQYDAIRNNNAGQTVPGTACAGLAGGPLGARVVQKGDYVQQEESRLNQLCHSPSAVPGWASGMPGSLMNFQRPTVRRGGGHALHKQSLPCAGSVRWLGRLVRLLGCVRLPGM
jgi:hypothetical protein